VNKKVLESLIKCGAMDTFRQPRAQMFAHLEKIMDTASGPSGSGPRASFPSLTRARNKIALNLL